MPVNAVQLEQVTKGDSLDLAPKWIPGFRRAIVFQSAGICRDRTGEIVDRKHSTIEQLDLDRQEVITLASDPKYDLLSPKWLRMVPSMISAVPTVPCGSQCGSRKH